MTFGASVLVGMAGQAAALVHHGQLSMTTILKWRQWNVSARQFVVASAAKIRLMAGCAAVPIYGGILAVNVVSPSHGV